MEHYGARCHGKYLEYHLITEGINQFKIRSGHLSEFYFTWALTSYFRKHKYNQIRTICKRYFPYVLVKNTFLIQYC